jgi:hypothetical protein
MRTMHNSVAAIRAAHPRTSFVRPSARHRERRLGLLGGALPRLMVVRRPARRGSSAWRALHVSQLVPASGAAQASSPLRTHPRFTWTRPGAGAERRSTTRDAAPWRG